MAMQNFQKQIVRMAIARAELYASYPRLYKSFDWVDTIISNEIPTLGVAPLYNKEMKLTGRYDMLWNPKFLDQLSDTQVQGVLMHEILHILLDHTTTRRPELVGKQFQNSSGHVYTKDQEDQVRNQIWNVAADLSINAMLRNLLKDPASKFKGGLFADEMNPPMADNRNAEWYYKQLIDDALKQNKDFQEMMDKLKEMMKGMQGEHGQWVEAEKQKDGSWKVTKGSKHGEANKDSKEKGSGSGNLNKEIKDSSDDGSDADSEDIESAEEMEKIRKETGLDKIQGSGNSTSTSSKVTLSVGKAKKTPGWMTQTKHTSVHGYDILPQLTRKVPNRRYGLNFPGKRRMQIGNKVLVAVDVSGSIDLPLYNEFCAHLNNMLRFADFDIIFFNSGLINKDGAHFSPDNAHLGTAKFHKGMIASIGGGTSFEPVIQFYNRVYKKYDALFIFTDGDAYYSTPPTRKKQVNWIVYTGNPEYAKNNCKDGNFYHMQRGE